jgi:hypothetical protein
MKNSDGIGEPCSWEMEEEDGETGTWTEREGEREREREREGGGGETLAWPGSPGEQTLLPAELTGRTRGMKWEGRERGSGPQL